MLRRYIQYDHKVEIDHLAPEVAAEDLHTEINRVQGEANRVVGHLAEIMVGGVIRGFDGREVNGPTYFRLAGSIILPRLINLERREGVIKAGAYAYNEIDLIGEYRLPQREGGAWLVSVRYRQQKMGPGKIEKFLGHCEVVQAEKGYMAEPAGTLVKQGSPNLRLTCWKQRAFISAIWLRSTPWLRCSAFWGSTRKLCDWMFLLAQDIEQWRY